MAFHLLVAGVRQICLATILLLCSPCVLPVEAQAMDLSKVLNRGAVKARIEELLLQASQAPSTELRQQLVDNEYFVMPVRGELRVAFVGEENSSAAVAKLLPSTLELLAASANLQVQYSMEANVVVVVGSDPYQELIERAPQEERSFLLSEVSGFLPFSEQARGSNVSCSAFQKVAKTGRLVMVYVFVDSDSVDSEVAACFSATLPAVVGLKVPSATTRRDGKYIDPQDFILTLVATNIIYSIPDVKEARGLHGVSETVIDAAIGRFYERLNER